MELVVMELICAASAAEATLPPLVVSQTFTPISWPIRVLLVEDSPEAAGLVDVYLGDDSNSFQIEWTRNLLDSMNRLKEPGIDVVLLDLGLPELSGHQSFRAIELGAGYKIPVVIFTADDRRVSRDLTLGFGASAYLLKGQSSPAQVKQALREAVLHFSHQEPDPLN